MIFFIKKDNMKQLKTILIWLPISALVLLTTSCNLGEDKTIILLGYFDGVISGAEIEFYDDNTFQYCSDSFLHKKCCCGNFNKNGNDIILKYDKEKPTHIKSEHIRIDEDLLVFLDEDGKSEHQFYIERKYLK